MEQTDFFAEQEKLQLSKEIEMALVKLTGKNVSLMSQKMGGNISFNEHLIIQRTLQTAKACIAIDKPESLSKDTNMSKTVVFKVVKPE